MSTTILLALVMGIALVSLSGGCAVKPSDGKRAESAAIPQAGHANAVQGGEATPEIGEFLRNYRSRLSASTDPTSLQTWAKSTLARTRIGEKRKPITLVRISAKSDTRFGKYSDSRFGLNSDTFRSGATLAQDS